MFFTNAKYSIEVGYVSSSLMISGKEVIVSTQSQWSDGIFD
jgi:hypothetical protein